MRPYRVPGELLQRSFGRSSLSLGSQSTKAYILRRVVISFRPFRWIRREKVQNEDTDCSSGRQRFSRGGFLEVLNSPCLALSGIWGRSALAKLADSHLVPANRSAGRAFYRPRVGGTDRCRRLVRNPKVTEILIGSEQGACHS